MAQVTIGKDWCRNDIDLNGMDWTLTYKSPEEWDIVIALGYKGNAVKEYCEAAYPTSYDPSIYNIFSSFYYSYDRVRVHLDHYTKLFRLI